MASDLSLLTILMTTFMLPIGIDCCSFTTNDIISLMSQPDYERNPCYIQWKAEQDAKWKELWKRRDELENSIKQNEENQRRSYENKQNTYTSAPLVKNKQVSTWLVLVIILGIFGVICCCGVCISICQMDEDSTALATTTSPQNHLNTLAFSGVSMTPAVNIDAPTNQTTSYSLPTNNANVNVIGTETRRPFSREANVPLLPRGVINRQNSLPSYDDVMRMPSAPPKE